MQELRRPVCASHAVPMSQEEKKKLAHVLMRRPDVQVITANPKTAGVARWNFLALWGHKQDQGEEASLDYCKKVSLLETCVHCNLDC